MRFQEGNEVRHKTARQKMVVKGYDGEEVICSWIDSKGEYKTARFEEYELVLWG